MNELRTSIVITLTGDLERRAARYGRAMQDMSARGQRHLNMLTRTAQSTGRAMEMLGSKWTAMLAGGGAAISATRAVQDAAALDKELARVAFTAGATADMVKALRKELFLMARQTGRPVEELVAGYSDLVAGGMAWDQAIYGLRAINETSSVTGSQMKTLAQATGVAAETFRFDLSDPKNAVLILDKMTKAGAQGRAELESLADIFAKTGGTAKAANLSFDQTLGLIEAMSYQVPQADQLATRVDSTLRLFTNQKYLEKAAKVTEVKFFDAEGQRRAAFDVLDEIGRKLRADFKTAQAQEEALALAFEGVDLDTIKGLRDLLVDETVLSRARRFSEELKNASGTVSSNLDSSLGNAVDQVGRLKAALREAADGFAEPINDVIERAVKYLMDDKQLSGQDMLVGGAVAAGGLLAGARYGGKLLSKVGGVAGNVAVGKALEETAGVTPVYVVNWPGASLPGGVPPGVPPTGRAPTPVRTPSNWGLLKNARMGDIAMLGRGAMLTAGGYVAGAGAAGYGAGTLINKAFIEGTPAADAIGGAVVRTLAFFGNEEAKQAVAMNEAARRMEEAATKIAQAEARVVVDVRGQAAVPTVQARNIDVDARAGLIMEGP